VDDERGLVCRGFVIYLGGILIFCGRVFRLLKIYLHGLYLPSLADPVNFGLSAMEDFMFKDYSLGNDTLVNVWMELLMEFRHDTEMVVFGAELSGGISNLLLGVRLIDFFDCLFLLSTVRNA
jgi:hypothetical protein